MTTSRQAVLLATLIIVAGIVGTLFYYYGYVVVETHEIPIQVSVSSNGTLGFDVDTDALDFGIIPFGGGGRKQLDIHNSHDFPVLAKFTLNGPTQGAVSLDPVEPLIEPNRTATVRVLLDSTALEPGTYTDTILITLTRT